MAETTKTTPAAPTKGTISDASNAPHDGPEYVHYSGESDTSYGLTEAAFADDGRSFRSNITGEWYPKQ